MPPIDDGPTELPLGERELDVMGVLWDRGSATVAEVRDALPVPLAYTTVLTILRNLEAKRLLRREEEGKAHRYFPRVERERARRGAVARLLEKLFGGSPELLAAQLVRDHGLDAQELARLRRALPADAREPTSREAASRDATPRAKGAAARPRRGGGGR